MAEVMHNIDTFAEEYLGAGTLLIMFALLLIGSIVFVLTDDTPMAWKKNEDGTTTVYYLTHKEIIEEEE